MVASTVAAQQPQVIPAIQQWSPTSGQFVFNQNSRIVPQGAALTRTSTTFQQDIFDLTGFVPQIAAIGTTPVTGDVLLKIDSTQSALGTEGYSINVGDTVTITAPTDTGVFYGTRTLLQLLHHNFQVAAGSGHDFPVYPERGLMLDCGQEFFSKDFILRHIREMAYLKLNYLHLHLSDEPGFRLESSSHPEIVSPQHYSKTDIIEILALAAQYHVTVVPEIDFPAHETAVLAAHPELQLPGHPNMFDLSKPGSYTLMQDILNEYLPLFPGPYWHAGFDEYLADGDYASYPQYSTYAQTLYGPGAKGQDLYVGAVDWIDGIVRAQGKTLRVWNDIYRVSTGFKIPNPDIVLELYSDGILASDALVKGHSVNNSNQLYLYYNIGFNGLVSRADPQNLYEHWTPDQELPGGESEARATPGLLGGKVHVWGAIPGAETESQVQDGIMQSLRGLSQNSWDSPKLVPTFAAFQPLIDAIGHTPAWMPDFSIIAPPTSVALSGGAVSFPIKIRTNSDLAGNVTTNCAAIPSNVTCSVTAVPGSLNYASELDATVTVHELKSAALHNRWPPELMLAVYGALCIFVRPRKQSLYWTVFLLLLVGCGGSSTTATQLQNNVQPTITVNFSIGGISHGTVISVQ